MVLKKNYLIRGLLIIISLKSDPKRAFFNPHFVLHVIRMITIWGGWLYSRKKDGAACPDRTGRG